MPAPRHTPRFALLGPAGPIRRPVSRIAPTAADLSLMRSVAIVQYLVGGTTLLAAALVLDETDRWGDTGFAILGGVALLVAAARHLRPGSTTLLYARLSNLAGVLFIALIVSVARPIGATPAFYLWPLLTAAYFLRRRDLAVVVVVFLVSFAVALWGFSERESELVIYVPLVLVVLVVTALVRLMRESLSALIGDLEVTAATDELTGLPNRASFLRSCRRDLERSRRVAAPYSVVLVDLDHFKSINDTLGHAAGDDALRRFAELLTAECRGGDLPARYGGEEFVVGLTDTDEDAAMRFAERLRARVERATMQDPAPLTLSAGVATTSAGGDEPGELIRRADEAMYEAKAGGRNRVVADA